MDLYRATFAGSLLLNSLVLLQTYRSRRTEDADATSSEKVEHRGREESDREGLRKLKWRFFPIYLLVNAADWLQGPYIYPIYKGMFKGLFGSESRLTICRRERSPRRDSCISVPHWIRLRRYFSILRRHVRRSIRPPDSMPGVLRPVFVLQLHFARRRYSDPVLGSRTRRNLWDSTLDRLRKLAGRRI